jgi:tRNA (mo5U34)-methyltransferase
VRQWDRERVQKGWWHSFELPDGRVIEGVADIAALKHRLSQFPIPENLAGKRVLDIGAWDGWFSFEMERRGAEVTSVDCWDNERFRYIHQELGSHVDYRILDVYDLDPAVIGRFYIVLFLG